MNHLFATPAGVVVREGYYDTGLHKFVFTADERPATHEEYPYTQMTPVPLSGSSQSHSRLAPSSSASWTKCTSSVGFVEANREKILPIKIAEVIKLTPYLQSIPKEEVFDYEWRAIEAVEKRRDNLTAADIDDIWKSSGNTASREGSRAHEFAAAILLGQKTLADIPEEFRLPVGIYVDHCNAIPGAERFIESKVPLFYSENPDDTGTCDFAVITSERITICDLKYGAGKFVDAVDNSQLATYCLSFVEANDALYDFDPSMIVEMHIVQPRHREYEEVRKWVMTLADLRIFCRDIHYAAIQIRENRGLKFAPGDETCMWCDAKRFCDARATYLTEAFATPDSTGIDFLAGLPDLTKEESKMGTEDRVVVRMGTFPDDNVLLAIKRGAKGIRELLDDIEELVDDRVLTGDYFGGRMKLVQGREGNRDWKDADAAEKFLAGQKLKKEERCTFKVIGPAPAEKLLAEKLKKTVTANRFKALITRSPGKPVAAFADDKRDAIQSAVELLPDLTNEEL